jgi:Protein of unknown function (DUF1566)
MMNKGPTKHKCIRSLLLLCIGLLLSSNSFAGVPVACPTKQQILNDIVKLKADHSAEATARQSADEQLKKQISSIPMPNCYVIGDTGPAGGKVFFVSADGLHGLEAALTDQGEDVPWNNNGKNIANNAVRDGVNAGSLNTQLITSNQGKGNYAAQLCAAYRGGGYGDWYLPSAGELALLYQQKNAVGGFDNDRYWSSTEIDDADVWIGYLNGGGQGNNSKNDKLAVRAIRAF